jgi:hypothetical protein
VCELEQMEGAAFRENHSKEPIHGRTWLPSQDVNDEQVCDGERHHAETGGRGNIEVNPCICGSKLT